MTTSRRGFLGQLSLGAATVGVSGWTTAALTGETDPWLNGLAGRHRIFLDVANMNVGNPLGRAASFMDVYSTAYAEHRVSVVFGAHGSGLGLVLGDASWSAYELGRRYSVPGAIAGSFAQQNVFSRRAADASSAAATNPTVAELQARGVRFLACKQAIGRLAREIASTRSIELETVRSALLSDLLPGVFAVPAMIIAASRAQEAGINYVFAG